MKRLLLSLTMAVLVTTAVFAQKANPQALLAKLDKSNTDIQDAKKNVKGTTWISRGDLFFEIATVNIGVIYEGMSESEAVLLIGKPLSNEIPIEEIGGTEYKKYSYDALEVYFTMEGKVAFWKETKPIYEKPLDEAVKAYAKAMEVDPKVAAKAKESIKRIINQYKIDGQNRYSLLDYKGASENFAQAATVSANPVIGIVDNEIMYYAGVAACQGEEFASAVKYLEDALKANYEAEGMVYYYIAYCKNKLEDKNGAEAILLQGVEKYPANQDILNALISQYISNNDDPTKVIPYIKKAQANDPTNVIMYVAEGVAYESMKDYAKAEAAYLKAIEMQADFFDPLYNLGLMYNVQGEDAVQELRTIDYTNQKAYAEKEAQAIDFFKKAIELFEKAHKLKPEDQNTIQLAKTLYFRLRDEGDQWKAGFERFDALEKK